jgi:mono/diheme cytochrome c family protein
MLTGCYYDKEDVLYPLSGSGCDTTVVTYSQSIVPIMTSSCISCHSGTSAASGIRLETYTGVKAMASNGMLVKVVTHAPGVSPMPKNAAKLNDCNIKKIQKWVAAGAPQN